ncbi:hypothetical protein [Longibacter salinarum]|uniref:hypothetical protein n=1 Tax=Longibacter salinarum TaxID=1850348 RepID=UPI0015CF27F0|nr:hypothetical protein [Longibacter salinarum]
MQWSAPLQSRTRWAVAIAAIALVAVYIFPIWQISLDAPQYPEGLGMEIWVHTVTGENPNDLQNINGLNHYIGMKEIDPDTIPELVYMPWIIAGLMVLGLGVALINRRWALALWATLFLLFAIAGMVDFYIWAYDYGHDLNPEAAIKVPGMSYMPPILGTKQMLNITAGSWPAIGGIIMMLSCAAACGLTAFELFWADTPDQNASDTDTAPSSAPASTDASIDVHPSASSASSSSTSVA